MSTTQDHVPELLDDFQRFLRTYYHDDILELADQFPNEQESLEISWQDLYQFDPSVADDLLDQPERIRLTLERALEQYDIPIDVDLSDAHVWVTDLSDDAILQVGEYRDEHVNTLIGITGVVSKATDVKPEAEEIAYECQRCGSLQYIPQDAEEKQTPYECQGCERQGPFIENIEESRRIDYKLVRVQRPPDQSVGGDPSFIDINLRHDLADAVTAGDRVTISAIARLTPEDDDARTYQWYADAKGVTILETDFEDIDVSAEDEERIKAIANSDPYRKLVDSICPSIYGNEHVKEALALQMFGGTTKDVGDGGKERGQSHVLLIGDPSTGKSTLLDYAARLAPRAIRSAGKTSSAAGITAAAVRDDFGPGGEWTIEGGAIVQADNGLAAIDELDSMNPEDRESLNEALEHQRVSVSKAGINATLRARTTLLAAANPVHGRFDPHGAIAEQIDLNPTLMSRFDLIFTFTDEVDKERDQQIAEHKAKVWKAGTKRANADYEEVDDDPAQPVIEPEVVRKYIAYARENVTPVPTDDAVDRVVEVYYNDLRQLNKGDDNTTIPITARSQEAIHRLAEASARIRLSDRVTVEDVDRVVRLIKDMLRDIGMNDDGEFDADIVETGVPMSQHRRIKTIESVVKKVNEEYADAPGAPLAAVADELDDEGIDPERFESDLEQLKNKGQVYQPEDDRVIWMD